MLRPFARGFTFFLLEEQDENFVAVVRKWEMLAATKVKMISGSEKKVNKNTYDIPSKKRVTMRNNKRIVVHKRQWNFL